MQNRNVYGVFDQEEFVVEEQYNVTREIGQSAHAIVCAATNTQTGEGVAIRKLTNILSKKIVAKRALKEIKLLQHFRGHPNIICLYGMDIPNPYDINQTYLYEELMECDLATIIRSKQALTDAHFQSIIYQTLCGLKYIHSANVLHRDIKPGNLLVNADCQVKICGFGLARGLNTGFTNDYIASRWYRAPEIMLSVQSYTTAVDVWSVGCILAELLGGRPIFKGHDNVDQLNQIVHCLGKPREDVLALIGTPHAQEYMRSLPVKYRIPLLNVFPHGSPLAVDLLTKMLVFDPMSRITAAEALQHPYFANWHDPLNEPDCPTTFDFDFDAVEDVSVMRDIVYDEVVQFRDVAWPQSQAHSQPEFQLVLEIPTPNNPDLGYEDLEPGSQEAPAADGGYPGDLESSLQRGMDVK